MRLIVTLTGAILLIQAVRMVLPLGSMGKYVSFVLGLFFMAVTLDALGGLHFRGEEVLSEEFPVVQTESLEQLQQEQIFKEYSNQLTRDIRQSIPPLADATFSFDFSLDPFGEVKHVTVFSAEEPQESVLNRLSQLYGIPREVISWNQN